MTGQEATGAAQRPVAAADRLAALDFIRGIAVVGIVFANVASMGHTGLAAMWPPALTGGSDRADDLVWLVQLVLIDGKMRGLFTLLFGAGMVLFAQRAGQADDNALLQLRRLAWLLGFGLLHLILLWHGDILHTYALCGMMLVAAVSWSARAKLTFGLMLYVLGSALLAAQTIPLGPGPAGAAALADAQVLAANAAEIARYRSSSFADLAGYMAWDRAPAMLQQSLFNALSETVPLALIGMALFDFGLFSGRAISARLRRWAWLGLIAGGIATLGLGLWASRSGFPLDITTFVFIGATPLPRLGMMLGLIVLLAHWTPRAARTATGLRFVAAGRVAFTSYIGTSLVLVPVFNGWGLGLFGRLDRTQLLGVAAAVAVLMLLCAKPWLERYRYGPLEWLWRCLTYGRRFELRR